MTNEVQYIRSISPHTGKMVYLTDPIWLSLVQEDGAGYQWMQHNSYREDVKAQVRKDGGIIFEDLLEKLKRNRDELSSVEVKILVEMYQMLEKALDIDRRHLEEYLRKRLKNGDGYLVR
ncbi:MAG TPA: hypothetical protein VE971_06375 [Candidatus Eisenbacteria bacterium]|nr:hypothetical protein [Candidatus Eisenbacteria bacterium]